MKIGREVQVACQMREPLEKERVFQTPGRKDQLHDLFQYWRSVAHLSGTGIVQRKFE